MGAHKCECFDVVAFGLIDFTSKKYKVLKKAGGKMEDAVQEAIDDATADAIDTGKGDLKKQTCASPCRRFRFVLPQIWQALPVFTGKGHEFTVHVTGQWTAYIVCYDPAKHPEGDGDGHRDGHRDGRDDEGAKPSDSGDKPKSSGGKPKKSTTKRRRTG